VRGSRFWPRASCRSSHTPPAPSGPAVTDSQFGGLVVGHVQRHDLAPPKPATRTKGRSARRLSCRPQCRPWRTPEQLLEFALAQRTAAPQLLDVDAPDVRGALALLGVHEPQPRLPQDAADRRHDLVDTRGNRRLAESRTGGLRVLMPERVEATGAPALCSVLKICFAAVVANIRNGAPQAVCATGWGRRNPESFL
jgi:hypothetical protein